MSLKIIEAIIKIITPPSSPTKENDVHFIITGKAEAVSIPPVGKDLEMGYKDWEINYQKNKINNGGIK
jgi:hypothetical protein